MAIEGQKTMSKTQHYRKVTKPLLERKRRARMNHYLDELKELIIETMESNGEHVTKLEKADILELTVEYLKSKKEQQTMLDCRAGSPKTTSTPTSGNGVVNAEKFRAGYTQAAYEVSKVFATVPEVNINFGSRLMKHLAYQLKDLYPVQSNDSEIIEINLSSSPTKRHQERGFHPYQRISQQQKDKNLPSGNDVWRPW